MYLHELRQNANTVHVSPIEKTLSNTNFRYAQDRIALTHDKTVYTLDTIGLTYTMRYRTEL